MSSALTNSAGRMGSRRDDLPHDHVRALLDTLEKGLLIADRKGYLVLRMPVPGNVSKSMG